MITLFDWSILRPRRAGRTLAILVVPLLLIATTRLAGSLSADPAILSGAGNTGCVLSGGLSGQSGEAIRHVISIQFDNVHFTRDEPGVPSDLEQMPNLLNFLLNHGVLDSNQHTPLISETADDLLTTLTGNYGDQVGQPVGNSFDVFDPGKASGVAEPSSFAYWTSPTSSAGVSYSQAQNTNSDTAPVLVTAQGKNAPAPWVPFTRAGCNVGAVSIVDMVPENYLVDQPALGLPLEATDTADHRAQTDADFLGLAIHCATEAPLCSTANGGLPDNLPDEPGGYDGFSALYGHKTIAPQLTADGSVNLQDVNGAVIQDCANHIGFPGFDGVTAARTLGYVAAMQEHGVPVTYAYISDAHDNHSCAPFNSTTNPPSFGPGEAGYVAQLKEYDAAWGAFFSRLKQDGIDQRNTLFVISADEGDHYVGGAPSNLGCDGAQTACQYSHIVCPGNDEAGCPSNNAGELDTSLTSLIRSQLSLTSRFSIHGGWAPAFSVPTLPPSSQSADQNDLELTRPLARGAADLTALNPLTGNTDRLALAFADQAEMRLLHMVTGDSQRTPTFIMFGAPAYLMHAGPGNCSPPGAGGFSPCTEAVNELPYSAWSHGDIPSEITSTWLGLVGPGVASQGLRSDLWSDHTDIRPTILLLTGLKDDYPHEGRALIDFVDDLALPQPLEAQRDTLSRLGAALKQINAPVGPLGLQSLTLSSYAVESGTSTDDSIHQAQDAVLGCIATRRDAIAGAMLGTIEGAEFNHQAFDEQQAISLIDQAQNLLRLVDQLADTSTATPESAASSW